MNIKNKSQCVNASTFVKSLKLTAKKRQKLFFRNFPSVCTLLFGYFLFPEIQKYLYKKTALKNSGRLFVQLIVCLLFYQLFHFGALRRCYFQEVNTGRRNCKVYRYIICIFDYRLQ